MYIKSLTIQGFKSYRDATIVDPFSPGVNVVVGRNGSGKSNFFSAIRFLLNDEYTSFGRDERQALLHEGSGPQNTFSAYVEAVFDNSDGRAPTGKDTLTLRRTIGAKKDEYSLDRKSTPKGEVMSLLESAGFSRSNPYYIVPQGRITHLTNIKDPQRLDLLKEVAGTKVYEDRRAESVRIMDDTEAKRIKIDELLEFIEERLAELEEEKQELKEFQQKDRERRSLQYAIHARELEEVGELLEEIEDERRRDIDNANERREAFNDRERTLTALEAELVEAKNALEVLALERRQCEEERKEALKARTQVACLVRDMEESAERGRTSTADLEEQLEHIEEDITAKESELMEAGPAAEDKALEERQTREALGEKQAQVDALYAKQGRSSQFRSQRERDRHLNAEVGKLRSAIEARQASATALAGDLQAAQSELATAEQLSTEIKSKLEGRRDEMKAKAAEMQAIHAEHNELLERRKELWKEDSKLSQTVQHARSERDRAEKNLNSTMDRNTSQALRAVAAITEAHNIEGVYGPLFDLFEVEDRYKTAVEVTAGNSLFHIVVDTDKTAERVLDIMIREKRGRCTFIPLNRIKPKEVNYPHANDAVALIRKLRYDRVHQLAFEQVFAKTIVCPTLETAGAYVRSHQLTAITLHGDKIDKKGSLTGGFHDVRSRLDCIKAFRQWRTRHDEERERLDEVKATLETVNQQITQCAGKMSKVQSSLSRATGDREPLVNESIQLQRDEDALRTRVKKLEDAHANQESDVRTMTAQVGACEQELATPMAQNLTDDEADRLNTLASEVATLKKVLVDVSRTRADLTSRKSLLEVELKEDLRRRREELRGKIEAASSTGLAQADGADDVEARKREVASLTKSIADTTRRTAELETETEKVAANITELEARLEKTQVQQADDGRSIQRQQKNVERYIAKRQLMLTNRDECNNKIRSLGVLPEEAFGKYTGQKSEKLLKQLHKVNESLKKFAHVNKKAFEQYQGFTDQRDKLVERREELEKSAESISELIEVLDQRKDEAIELTFKQVSKNFEEVFEKLVPLGRGRLIMQKRLDQRDDDGSENEDQAAGGSVSQYTGVSIKVSFNSKTDEGLRIQQLSGGQKSLVALATIFAIQKVDPAPFYLFDEIDANLDPDRRTSVAAMIGELGKGAQMICTTFRPEMLEHADTFLGVIFDNRKISTIKQIEKTHAQQFVESNERTGTQAK